MHTCYALAGRWMYGLAITAFGILCMGYMNFINSLQPVPESIPGHGLLAVLLGLALALAGMSIVSGVRAVHAGFFVAVLFLAGIVVLHIPSAFTNPALLRSPWWIRTFESLALAGAALILAGLAAGDGREAWVRRGRVMFGISLPVFGVLHFVYAGNVASLIPAWYPWPLFLAYLTGFGHFAAGVAIVSGVVARLAAILAGFMYATWAITLHVPRVLAPPPGSMGERAELTSLVVCVAFSGAAWIVAGSLAGPRRRAAADAAPV